MDKINEFLINLEEELKYLKPKDSSEILKYYRDKINIAQDYGESEEKIIASFPSPQKIAEDTYKSKGIAYLQVRKKQVRKQEITKGIFSGIIVLLILCAFIVINIYLISSIIQLTKLFIDSFKMNTLLDIISISLMSLAYIFIILIIMIYIFDLLYILSSHFVYDVLYVFDKKHHEYKFMDFTISGFIEKLTKQKKIIFKVLMGCLICFVSLGVINYISKGYMYRSMNNTTVAVNEYEIDDVNKIVLEDSEIIIDVTQSSRINNIIFKYGAEINDELEYEIKDGICYISKINSKKYDLLGILNEPLAKLEIIIPNTYILENLELNISNGSLDINEVKNISNLKLDLDVTNFALTKSVLNKLELVSSESNIGFDDNIINNSNIIISSGTFNINKGAYLDSEINNKLAKLKINEITANSLKINSESATNGLKQITANSFSYNDISTGSTLEDIYTNIADISSFKNSSINITRIVAKEKLDLSNQSGGNFTLRYVKTSNINASFSSGQVNLYDVNMNDTNTLDQENTYITKYNEYNVSCDINLISNATNINVEDVEFNKATLELNDGRFDISSGNIANSDIKVNECNLVMNDVDGQIMYIYANGGFISFYNDEIKQSNIELKIEGELIKTTLDIDKDSLKGFTRG